MRKLQNIFDLDQFIWMSESKKSSYSSMPWWDDCIHHVEVSLFSDKTTTSDNLREKAKNYAINFIALQPELSCIDKQGLVDEIADRIEANLKNAEFDQRPPASVVAQKDRQKIPERPENKFVKLQP